LSAFASFATGVFCRARFFSSRTSSLVHSRRLDVLDISLPNFCFGNRRSISLNRIFQDVFRDRVAERAFRPTTIGGLFVRSFVSASATASGVAATNSSTPTPSHARAIRTNYASRSRGAGATPQPRRPSSAMNSQTLGRPAQPAENNAEQAAASNARVCSNARRRDWFSPRVGAWSERNEKARLKF
jgi:hypothetical protein